MPIVKALARLNPLFRSLARALPAENRLRRSVARWWDQVFARRDDAVRVRLHGETVWLSARWRSLDADYEKEALSSFLGAIRPNDSVWDVGGHIGIYSLFAAKRVGAGGRVAVWEPSPLSFQLLSRHLEHNRVAGQCRLIHELISDAQRDDVEFIVDGHHEDSSRNRIVSHATRDSSGHHLKLKSNTIDYWASCLGAPDVVKMDIEGAEWFAVNGAKRLLDGEFGRRPKILLSCHPVEIQHFGGTTSGLETAVRAHGYRVLSLAGKPTTLSDFGEYWLVAETEADDFAARIGKNA